MRILVSNDDGINAPGLRRLVKELGIAGHEVYVVAPLNHMSGSGKALRVRAKYGEVSINGASRAWWVDSTPATAIYLGLNLLMDERPDLVVSGINRGPNIGLEDFLTSGTIGAAIEAALNSIPGVAVSLASDKAYGMEDYGIAAIVVRAMLSDAINVKPTSVININVPVNPKGVKSTRLAWNNYRIPLRNVNGRVEPAVEGFRARYWDVREGTDVWAVLNDYVSVSVIDLDNFILLTDLKASETIASRIEKVMSLAK